MTTASKTSRLPLLLLTLIALAGCSQMPTSGPNQEEINESAARQGGLVQLIDIDENVTRRLLAQRKSTQFAETLGQQPAAPPVIGPGDTLEVSIWEAPPATLFGGATDTRNPGTSRPAGLPELVVDHEGFITVPFAGRIKAAGLQPQALQAEVVQRLKGKANQPEVLVRVLRNASSTITVVGEVTNSLRMPLTASGERLLDALAAAGGVRQPVTKTMLQVTRGDTLQSMPLDLVIRNPRQNVPLRPGDVVTALFQPLSFTALGATGKNEEIGFEAQGISLAQAIARAGGLQDTRSDARGVFIFRLEAPDTLEWPRRPVATTPDGLVPVVYRLDLKRPESFFVMQSFPVNHRDVLYVSNAPAVEVQKFLNLIFSVIYPVSATKALLP